MSSSYSNRLERPRGTRSGTGLGSISRLDAGAEFVFGPKTPQTFAFPPPFQRKQIWQRNKPVILSYICQTVAEVLHELQSWAVLTAGATAIPISFRLVSS